MEGCFTGGTESLLVVYAVEPGWTVERCGTTSVQRSLGRSPYAEGIELRSIVRRPNTVPTTSIRPLDSGRDRVGHRSISSQSVGGLAVFHGVRRCLHVVADCAACGCRGRRGAILNECNRLWLLKNSLFVSNSQNWGDRKCLPDPRKLIVGLS